MRPAGQRYKADYKIKQEMLNNIGMEVHVAVDDDSHDRYIDEQDLNRIVLSQHWPSEVNPPFVHDIRLRPLSKLWGSLQSFGRIHD